MDILADSPLIPASFFLVPMSSTHPPPKADSLTFMPFWFLFCDLWLCCAWLSFYLVCPCPNRAFGKGEAYFLVAFFLSLFLAFGSCPAPLSVIHGTWWPQVSCCGRFLFVHSSGVTLCVSRHLLLSFLSAALMLFLCLMRITRLSSASLFSMRL